MPTCPDPDCQKQISSEYGVQADDWKLLDEWYEKRGRANPYIS